MPEQTLKLKDIKSIVAVPDHSLWLFGALVIAAVVAAGLIALWFFRRHQSRIDRRRVLALKRLDAIDYRDAKQAAYDFSLLGHFVATPKTAPEFAAIIQDLEPYKFKKEVLPLDAALQKRMQTFIKEAHRG